MYQTQPIGNPSLVFKQGKSILVHVRYRGGFGVRLILSLIFSGSVVIAGDSGGDYTVIIERNAFGLQPLSIVDVREQPSAPRELPVIRLTGMYSQAGVTRVFLVKEPRGAQPESLSLTNGENKDGVEVKEADSRQGFVRLRVDGTELILSFHGQQVAEKAARMAEEKFADDHARAHEMLQRRLQEEQGREAGRSPSVTASNTEKP